MNDEVKVLKKILKHGKFKCDKGDQYFACPICHCEFEADSHSYDCELFHQSKKGSIFKYKTTCPECNAETTKEQIWCFKCQQCTENHNKYRQHRINKEERYDCEKCGEAVHSVLRL